jgi:hypothetical protein
MIGKRGGGLVALTVIAVAVAGCGYRRPARVPVEGVVTLDGRPLAGAAVMLVPEAGGRAGLGGTDKEGRFTISTYGAGDGAVFGPHRVVVTKFVSKKQRRAAADDATEAVESVNSLPVVYAAPQTTPFSVNVRWGLPPLELALESPEKPAKQK